MRRATGGREGHTHGEGRRHPDGGGIKGEAAGAQVALDLDVAAQHGDGGHKAQLGNPLEAGACGVEGEERAQGGCNRRTGE